ncbi:hypothetical protein NPJ88_000345 [Halomonas elongata]|uniref:hypothetical protein n=1 Tax=Halomonas elongata TaxID=2746 RepID=UPI00255AB8C2|nr:hypothetical protein [Halomonas elongata]MDL4860772.1 hypothetical protein [Halomonas elongata]
MSLTKAELEKIISQLQDIPPPSDEERLLSQREVIQRIRPVIKKLRQKGYSPQQVQAILEDSGLEISRRQIDLSIKKKSKRRGQPSASTRTTQPSRSESSSSNKQPESSSASRKKPETHKPSTSSNNDPSSDVTSHGSAHFTPDPDQEDI